jgi:hypothetical protein
VPAGGDGKAGHAPPPEFLQKIKIEEKQEMCQILIIEIKISVKNIFMSYKYSKVTSKNSFKRLKQKFVTEFLAAFP